MADILDCSAVTEVARLARAAAALVAIEIDGKAYSTVPLFDPRKKEPLVEPLVVHSLAGIRDYLVENRDNLTREALMLHVVGPREVRLIGPTFGDFAQRECYVVAKVYDRFQDLHFQIGDWCELEEMVIALQALFVASHDRADVLKLLGNVKDEQVKTAADDGTTQTVTARAGIANVDNVKVPNPVILAPHASFPVIEQPPVPFVLRLRQSTGLPEVALFMCDGAEWKNQAIERIRDWFALELAGESPPIAIIR